MVVDGGEKEKNNKPIFFSPFFSHMRRHKMLTQVKTPAQLVAWDFFLLTLFLPSCASSSLQEAEKEGKKTKKRPRKHKKNSERRERKAIGKGVQVIWTRGGERERVGDKGVKAPLVSQHDESFRFPIYYF